jgi:hypothetical protein
MKELEKDELIEINAGFWWVLEVIAAGLTYELITEGFEKCASDFKSGNNRNQKRTKQFKCKRIIYNRDESY